MTRPQPSPAPGWSRRSVLGLLGAAPMMMGVPSAARAASPRAGELEGRVKEIMGRPEFAGARWGMEFYSPGTGRAVYSLNASELFNPGSSFKVFPAGTAFETLGPDHRFRTRVYRTGPLVKGVLKGDLVLVAGGDLLLSGRVRRDGSLELPTPDHSYDRNEGAGPLPGDPLVEIRRLARQVAAHGVRQVEGRVLVDISLFREGRESLANGMNATMSPIMVNDNLVDITVRPGGAAGEPAVLDISPQNAYIRVVNDVTTVAAGARPLTFTGAADAPDGTHHVTITGDVPLGVKSLFRACYAPQPARFAAMLFTEALRDEGVRAEAGSTATPDFAELSSHYTRKRMLAEHVSPPLPEELKVMLKVSSNIHTGMWPYLIGAIAGGDAENPRAAGLKLQSRLFEEAGLDGTPPGASEHRYTPEFFTRFLAHMSRKPYYRTYRLTLPILGRDGSLAHVQPDSPAAGHVFAKTGTGIMMSDTAVGISKGLAGFVELPDGQVLTFGTFMHLSSAPGGGSASADAAGQALGEIAAAAYESFAPR
ncbi:D-alanyl-D-alanine carboxypeptidase/D-alanyl-D-alanine-endopeptidase [Nonomuraea sp. B12E4]|uniref:D-alanyl-D-alanine carboxypeptidase/D-alanyl-D-alanine endopeptidase n=1 Tax=Nonomuraea sp. B12E4 TaxID=3153564 RepID=UPI00325DCD22